MFDSIIKNKNIIKISDKNIRTDKDGYLWGKSLNDSNLLNQEEKKQYSLCNAIAERWICSDDREYPSYIKNNKHKIYLFEFLEKYSEKVFNKKYLEKYGCYLSVLMKLIDTNKVKNKGSLSLQIHPEIGYSYLPAKPEMWLSLSNDTKIFIGWNKNVSEDFIKTEIFKDNLFNSLNKLSLPFNSRIVVEPGLVHAIRYNSFLAEWSLAPNIKNIKKARLKNATIALLDNTDGKVPRQGKVNLELALDILKNSKNGFMPIKSEDLIRDINIIYNDNKGNLIKKIFDFENIIVEEINIKDKIILNNLDNISSCFVFSGSIEIRTNNNKQVLNTSDEFILPYYIKYIEIINKSKNITVLFRWYKI